MGIQLTLLQRGNSHPILGAYLLRPNGYMDQDVTWYMSLGMEVGLGPGDFVLDEEPDPPPQKGPQIFGPCLLRPNGWMDEAGTWHGGRLQPRRLCVRRGPSLLPQKGWRSPPPEFSAHF